MLNFPSYQKELSQTQYQRQRPKIPQEGFSTRANTAQLQNGGSLKQNIEGRNYNIITQQSTKLYPQSQLPKLGQKKDFPYPKNRINYDSNITYEKQQNNNQASYKALTNTKYKNIEPKNLMNCSAQNFNFLTLTRNNLESKTYKDLKNQDVNIAQKTCQIAKITDRGRLCAPNYNKDFQDSYKENQLAFKRHKGLCADVYNRAHSYGPGIKPFRKFK